MERKSHEKEFEIRIRKLLDDNLDKKRFSIMKNKDVTDIIILDNVNASIFFIEVKHYVVTNGRVEIGGKGGSGFQPEILGAKYPFFEKNLRWVLGAENDDKIHFVDNDTIRKYLAGEGLAEKYNNLQLSFFKEDEGNNEAEFIEKIKLWLR